MSAGPHRRKLSVAIKLHRSAVKLKNLTFGNVSASATKPDTDQEEGNRPVWTNQYPMNIVGYTKEDRAKSLDGGFFEDFVILEYKHEGQIEQAKEDANKVDRSMEKASEISLSGAAGLDSKKLSKQEVELLYLDMLHIVINHLGKRAFGKDFLSDGDLYVYAQEVLGVTKEQHRRLYGLAKQKKPPDSYVKVQVKEAKDLEAKDANGFSDPYCMLSLIKVGIGDKPSKDGKKPKKIVLREFMDEVLVRTTRIKSNTLNPVWDENFLLKINSFQEEILRIDIWDHDDNTVFLDEDNRITSIRGFSGVGRFIKEVVQSTKCNESTVDDFLGIVEIPLKDIPSIGLDEWFELQARSSKSHVEGHLHLKLELLGCRDAHPTADKKCNSGSLKVRRQLWERFIIHEAKRFFEEEPDEIYWNVSISPHAKCFLTQHAVQSALSKFQLLVSEWEVMNKCQKDIPIPMDKFVDLASHFKIYSNCQDLNMEEEKVFVDSLDEFVDYCYQLLRQHRHLYPASIPEKCLRLGNMLLCLMTLYKLPIFQNYFPEKRLIPDLEEALKTSTLTWFATTEAYFEPRRQTAQEELTSLVNLTNAVNVDLVRSSSYSTLFRGISIDYYTFTYNNIESLMIQSVKSRVIDLSKRFGYGIEHDKVGTTMFELYVALRDMTEHKEQVPEEHRKENGIEEYYNWFKSAVIKWLDLAKEKAILRIKRAVEIDEDHVVHAMLKHSASAVDVTCCLGQICMFWKNLRWPDPSGAFTFVAKIADILSSATTEYGKIMLMKLKSVGYYDTTGRFDISEKLCISLNNLEHVLGFLDSIPSVLKFEDIIMEVCNLYGADRDASVRSTLMNVLECAKDDLREKLNKVIDRIGKKMSPDIIRYLDQIIQVSRGKEDCEAVDPLLDYLDQNLITLHDSLLEPVFEKMLNSFWKFFLLSVEEFAKKTSKSRQERFVILSGVIEQAREFFSAEGQGIQEETLHSSMERRIERLLFLYASSSEIVIQKYYSEKCQEQARAKERFGALDFKVFYSQQNHALHVSIVHARNLLPLDNTGSSDPFVTMELLPKHLFPNQVEQKTTVKSKTVFPVFDENFSFEIPSSLCLQDGATLVLTVYDHDLVSDNDIAGEVFFDLNNTLGLETEISGGFSCIEVIEVPLIHGSPKGESYTILQERTDSKATSFIQQRQAKVRKMADDVVRGRKISESMQ